MWASPIPEQGTAWGRELTEFPRLRHGQETEEAEREEGRFLRLVQEIAEAVDSSRSGGEGGGGRKKVRQKRGEREIEGGD